MQGFSTLPLLLSMASIFTASGTAAAIVTTIPSLAPQLPQCQKLANNTCMRGSTTYRKESGISDAPACCSLCVADPACAAFTFKRVTSKTQPAQLIGVCLFHPLAVSTTPGNCTSASVRHAPTPPPAPPTPPPPEPASVRNVLHVIVDDLRPQLGAYGQPQMVTPNFDALAGKSTLFDGAYVQCALCGPSRNSFMTGRRPDATRTYNFADHFREPGVGDTWWPLPQIFREHPGVLALGVGKTYHPGHPPKFDGHNSWSPEALDTGKHAGYIEFPGDECPLPQPGLANATHYAPEAVGGAARWDRAAKAGGFSAGLVGCAAPTMQDPNVTAAAIGYMRLARAQARPFYLAVGLHKPHLPFHAPQRFWDLYPPQNVTLPAHRTFPRHAPPIAYRDNDGRPDVPSPWLPLPDNRTRDIRRAYMAAVSFMDAQLGKLVAALDDLGLANNTAIVFHGDHGWSLGEHNNYRKMAVFELSTRIPLVVHVPWLPPARRVARSAQLVEAVDILPTVCELAGIPLPTNQSYDGVSLVPALDSAHQSVGAGGVGTKNASFSQYARVLKDPGQAPAFPLTPTAANLSNMWIDNAAGGANRSLFYAVGHSMRTARWRYTEWVRWNATADAPAWDLPLVGRELYDHEHDKVGDLDSAAEAVNVAGDDAHALIVANLSASLRYFFRVAQCTKTLCTPGEQAAARAAQGITTAPR